MESWLPDLWALCVAPALYSKDPEWVVLEDKTRYLSSYTSQLSRQLAESHSKDVTPETRHASQCRTVTRYKLSYFPVYRGLSESPLFASKPVTKLPKLALRSGSPLRSKNQVVKSQNENNNRRESINSSGYVSQTSQALSPKTPPPPRPVHPPPAQSNVMSFEELKKWEEALKLREIDLNKREASVFEVSFRTCSTEKKCPF